MASGMVYLYDAENVMIRDHRYKHKGERKDLMKIFYLHSLQNVCYSLTGTELNINLKP